MTRIPIIKQAILNNLGAGCADLVYDDHPNEIKLPVSIDGTDHDVIFRIEEYIYEIVFPYGVEFNFVDGEHYTDDEVIGDIKDVVAAIYDSKVKVIAKRLFWMTTHEYVGLDEERFASTKSIKDFIVGKLGLAENAHVLSLQVGFLESDNK